MTGYGRLLTAAWVCLVCCGVKVSVATMMNPGFESERNAVMPNGNSTSSYEYWGMPNNWSWRSAGHTNGHGDGYTWSSDGDWSLYVFASSGGSHAPGDYLEFYQSVDLTGMGELLFDVYLRGGTYTHSYVAVDSARLWVRTQAGTLYDVSLDVSGFSGVHEIKLGVEVFQSYGDYADGWTYFDNVRLAPEPAALGLLVLGGFGLLRKRRYAKRS